MDPTQVSVLSWSPGIPIPWYQSRLGLVKPGLCLTLAQRSQDTVKNSWWRKPWLCVGWKSTNLDRFLIVKSQGDEGSGVTGPDEQLTERGWRGGEEEEESDWAEPRREAGHPHERRVPQVLRPIHTPHREGHVRGLPKVHYQQEQEAMESFAFPYDLMFWYLAMQKFLTL